MNVSNILSECFPFFGTLSDTDRDFLIKNTYKASYKKGTAIHDGNQCTGVIFVRSGVLRVYMLSESGKEVTFYRLFPGDICILSAFCFEKNITFDVSVNAEEDSECFVVAGHAFAALSDRVPSVKIFALQATVDRFSTVIEVIQGILFMSFDRRLAAFLLNELARNGGDTVHLTHEEIAKYMGSAREVVTRTVKKLTEDGLVAASRGEVRILDKKRLRAMTT